MPEARAIRVCRLAVVVLCSVHLGSGDAGANFTQAAGNAADPFENITTASPSPVSKLDSYDSGNATSSDLLNKTFRPSPMLEMHFDFRPIPVPPVQPEAKHLHLKFPQDNEELGSMEAAPDVKFPESQPKSAEKKAEEGFLRDDRGKEELTGEVYGQPSKAEGHFSPLNRVESASYNGYNYEKPIYQGFGYSPNGPPQSVQPPVAPPPGPYSWVSKSRYPTNPAHIPDERGAERTHPYPFYQPDRNYPPDRDYPPPEKDYLPSIAYPPAPGKDYQVGHSHKSTWQKFLKLFATLVPIGLFLSALTPSVLTVEAVNTTVMPLLPAATFYRDLEGHADVPLPLALVDFTKSGCEARLLCELSVLAKPMYTTTIQRLFKQLADGMTGEDSEPSSELKDVVNAVKKKNCAPLTC